VIGSVASGRIFVLDDHEANVRLLEQLLSRSGFGNVRSFRSGPELLEALPGDEPDLVLLDLHMPGMDGVAVLRALRSFATAGRYLPVVVLTADAERAARTAALEAGASDFLVKPFDAEEVVLRVRNLLETRRLHASIEARNAELLAQVAERTTDLKETESRWAEVVTSLAQLTALETPEATADAVSAAMAALPDLVFVSVLAFGAGGSTIPLAGRPTLDGLPLHRPLPADWSTLIRERVGAGTWFGSWLQFGDGKVMPQPFDRDLTAVALVPLRTSGGLLGALAAGTVGEQGPTLLARRVPALEAFAALSAALLAPGILARQRDDTVRNRIERVIESRAFRPVFQPIVSLDSGRAVGFEALTRFADGSRPDRRFADADAIGLGLELETACLGASIEAARRLPETSWLSLNVSPALVLEHERLASVTAAASVEIVLEITEHVAIDDYSAFRAAIALLGPNVRTAIDDAGAGFSSLRHILELRPYAVKLDIGLVRSIETDPARQALIAGMAYFAVKTGCVLVAEGIETAAERDALRGLAVPFAQGYLLGMPASAEENAVAAPVQSRPRATRSPARRRDAGLRGDARRRGGGDGDVGDRAPTPVR
jgi:EAL domain-containing protein (putative c-di-GMP-specific phosphodiesterase class I)/DNA-binding response OmpR family regulator